MAANLCSCICSTCHETCKMCNQACLGLCDWCKNPFFSYVAVTTCLNVPPAIYSITSMLLLIESNGINNTNCRGKTWLTMNLLFCIINIIASWYLYYKIYKSFGYEDTELQNRHGAFSRASYILSYDPIISIYIVILTSFFIWQIIGISWISDSTTTCPDNIIDNFGTSLGFGWAFIFIGSCSFCSSLCCAGCDSKEYGHNYNSTTTYAQVQEYNVPDYSVVTGLFSTTKPQPQSVLQTNDPNIPYNQIPIAIAVPLPS